MVIPLTDAQVVRGPNKTKLRSYFKTAIMRESIRRSREDCVTRSQWTTDPIFLDYKFCNVHREHDKVTVWLRENWRKPYKDHPNLLFAMALARLINWPPTLERIGFPKRWHPERVEDLLLERKSLGEKVYTGAYLLGAVPAGVPRQVYLVWDVLTPLKKNLGAFSNEWLKEQLTLEQSWDYFTGFHGIGSFLAYEIVSDLRHTKYLNKAPDIMTWANAGPGALRGLTRVWGHQPKTRRNDGSEVNFPKKYALEAMQLLLAKSRTELPKWMQRWEMRDVEHWLCEFDKYERIRLGQGVLERFTPKAKGEW